MLGNLRCLEFPSGKFFDWSRGQFLMGHVGHGSLSAVPWRSVNVVVRMRAEEPEEETMTWETLRSTCLLNCNDEVFTQCVTDVIDRLMTSHVINGSACHDVTTYVTVNILSKIKSGREWGYNAQLRHDGEAPILIINFFRLNFKTKGSSTNVDIQ